MERRNLNLRCDITKAGRVILRVIDLDDNETLLMTSAPTVAGAVHSKWCSASTEIFNKIEKRLRMLDNGVNIKGDHIGECLAIAGG